MRARSSADPPHDHGRRPEPLAAAKSGETPRHDPTILIVAQPATVYPEQMFEQGVVAALADMKVNPLDPMRTAQDAELLGRLGELQNARPRRCRGTGLQVTNHLAGGVCPARFS